MFTGHGETFECPLKIAKLNFMALPDDIADLVFRIEKFAANSASISFPESGKKVEVELESKDRKMIFHLNVIRSPKQRKQVTFNLRYREIYSIRRLDFHANHANPDVTPPDPIFAPYVGHRFKQEDHLHIHTEIFNDRWAIPLADFAELDIEEADSLPEKLRKFLTYCNVQGVEFSQPIF